MDSTSWATLAFISIVVDEVAGLTLTAGKFVVGKVIGADGAVLDIFDGTSGAAFTLGGGEWVETIDTSSAGGCGGITYQAIGEFDVAGGAIFRIG